MTAVAQSADESSLKAAAFADLSTFFRHAERIDLLPGPGVPEVWLYGPVRTQTRDGHPRISLCSIPVLTFDYYAPQAQDAPPSQIAPGRAISNVDTQTVYRLLEEGTCASQTPSWRWFSLQDAGHMDGDAMLEVAELALGIINGLKSRAAAFADLDLIRFQQSAPTGAIDALRRESLQRIGSMSSQSCPPDETSFCRLAEIQFGSMGPLTHLRLTIRESKTAGGAASIQSATVWTDFSAIP
jgi:hypothetical protein